MFPLNNVAAHDPLLFSRQLIKINVYCISLESSTTSFASTNTSEHSECRFVFTNPSSSSSSLPPNLISVLDHVYAFRFADPTPTTNRGDMATLLAVMIFIAEHVPEWPTIQWTIYFQYTGKLAHSSANNKTLASISCSLSP